MIPTRNPIRRPRSSHGDSVLRRKTEANSRTTAIIPSSIVNSLLGHFLDYNFLEEAFIEDNSTSPLG
jgi:hypothetical protein